VAARAQRFGPFEIALYIRGVRRNLRLSIDEPMQNKRSILGALLVTGLLAAGCAGPEKKLGRGVNNFYDLVRGGEMRRTVEQSALFDSPETAYTTGVIRGFNRTLARAGIGLYEIITAPIPNHKGGDYGPICTSYLKPNPVYPDSYTPRLIEDSTFATDASIGFSGGDIAPMMPGSRFRLWDN
jgi:putative exosortase-associated protein (TIGR04073 family)